MDTRLSPHRTPKRKTKITETPSEPAPAALDGFVGFEEPQCRAAGLGVAQHHLHVPPGLRGLDGEPVAGHLSPRALQLVRGVCVFQEWTPSGEPSSKFRRFCILDQTSSLLSSSVAPFLFLLFFGGCPTKHGLPQEAQAISPTAALFSARTTPQPSQNPVEPSWNAGGTLVEPSWNPRGTLVEPCLRAAPDHPGAYLG